MRYILDLAKWFACFYIAGLVFSFIIEIWTLIIQDNLVAELSWKEFIIIPFTTAIFPMFIGIVPFVAKLINDNKKEKFYRSRSG